MALLNVEENMRVSMDCLVLVILHQSWMFTGRTDAEAEAPILRPPDVKNWLTGKDPDAGKDWRQEEKGTTEDEMVGWHHRLDGHEFGQAPGVDDGQRNLACCSPWGCKDSDMTKRLTWTELRAGEINIAKHTLWKRKIGDLMKNWKYTYSSTPRQILKRNYVTCGTNAYENFHNSNVHNDKTKTENLGRKQNALEKRMDNSIHLYNVELFCLEMKELQLYATLWIQLENIKRSEEMKHSAEGYVHKVCFLKLEGMIWPWCWETLRAGGEGGGRWWDA